MEFKELKEWCKNRNLGFYSKEDLEAKYPEVLEAFEKELSCCTNRVGCFVYHSHKTENGTLKFKGMEIGYYIRSKNPFSWRFRKTYGNC